MGAWDDYEVGLIPHIHKHDDPQRNAFEDALRYQYIRIKENLKRRFPDKADDEIRHMMLFGEIEDGKFDE